MGAQEAKPEAHTRRSSASFCRHCASQLEESHRFCPSCGAAASTVTSPSDPLIGRTIAGTYAIRELIGQGGMGRIYRAEQTTLGRSVAVKVVNPLLLTNEEVVARFYREARAASALNHPNSVSVIDFGRTDDGVLYMVMELLRGRDLAAVTEDDGLLALDRVCRIMIDVLSALDEAHAAGVVHRDLKPGNIIVEQRKSGRDLVKVVDFGIATLATEQSPSVTLPGLLYGTPSYMSPEQVRGGVLDGRSDLYAAGVVMFELLTGSQLFSADTPGDVALCHVNAAPRDPREVAPRREIPPALARLVLRALEKDREDRFEHASEMAEALQDVLQQLPRRERSSGALQPSESRPAPGATAKPLTPGSPPAAVVPSAPSTGERSAPVAPPRFLGREAELARLQELHAEAARGPVFAQILGEIGIGKTRLVAELARAPRAAGQRVIEVGPHPSLAPVPYHPVRTLVAALLETDDAGLERYADAAPDRFVRAGILELLGRRRATRGVRLPRTKAVVRALCTVLCERAPLAAAPLLIVFEDAGQYDGATLSVLALLPAQLQKAAVLCCTTLSERSQLFAAHGQPIVLDKLSRSHAKAYLGSEAAASEPSTQAPAMLPLYLEQLRHLKWSLHGALPRDLGEAVSQRLDRVEPSARRTLQAAAVAGMSMTREQLRALAGDEADANVEALVGSSLLRVSGEEIAFEHPYLRDLVAASIPAGSRAELHARAHTWLVARDAALEVRAQHAAQTDDLIGASMLLDEVASAARSRGDTETALSALHRGWKLARKECAAAAHPVVVNVFSSMSRALAATLADKGDLAGAEGVLREQLTQCDPRGQQRTAILIDLGVVAMRRGRSREAQQLLVEALLVAAADGARELEAFAHASMAELKGLEKNVRGQLDSLMTAHQLFSQLGTRPAVECAIALRLGAAMHRAGDLSGSASALSHAQALAVHAPELAAQAAFGRMLVEASRRNASSARALGEEARRLAADGGDVDLALRIDETLAALMRGRMPDPTFEPVGLDWLHCQ